MMSFNGDDKSKRVPVEVLDWIGLARYTQLLSHGDESKVKICMIDEEQEEIRLQTKEDFDLNVQCARELGWSELRLVIYLNGEVLFHGIYKIEKALEKVFFPSDKLQMLIDNALAEKWYIPVKQDEALGVCLLAAIRLAQEGKMETNAECQLLIEQILPEAFRKLHTTSSVHAWPREIQYGIFEMTEILLDLVGTRLRSPPVPITLLNTLAMVFDTETAFSQKHKDESLPTRRAYALPEDDFLRTDLEKETFGWLRSLLQRFIAQNSLKRVRLQFEYIDSANSNKAATEYTALLKLFSKCHSCINPHRYRLIFARPIQQAIQYLQRQTPSDEINELNKTLTEICQVYNIKDEVDQSLASVFNPTLTDSVSRLEEQQPLVELPSIGRRKSKGHDYYEALVDNLHSMTMSSNDLEPKNVKKQRTDEQAAGPLFTRNHVMDCIDELLTSSDKRTLKRKHRRDLQRSTLTSSNQVTNTKKELKRSNTIAIVSTQTYDRSNPEDVLRYFTPMKIKVASLYDDLQTATCHGKLREVLKIEEKLKLLNPFSARFIADENTPDGTIMRPGQAFRKAWILLNDGSLSWDNEDIQLINLADAIRVVQAPIVPVTAPHDKAMITVDYICPNQPGTYESKWILAYRQKTFGPMIWCSIEVRSPAKEENTCQSVMKTSTFDEIKEAFEFVDVPLPACFDLSKPFQVESKFTSNASSLRSSFILPRHASTEGSLTENEKLDIDCFLSDSDSLLSLSFSPVAPETDPTPLIELAPSSNQSSADPPVLANTHEENSSSTMTMTVTDEDDTAARTNPPMDFVDTVVNNFFSVAKQAGSTAKAIFNTLQAFEEPISPPVQNERPALVNTYFSDQLGGSSFFAPSRQTSSTSSSSVSSLDPMKTLIEMGFANRAKNQRLLRENGNDLAKVIEILTLDTIEDPDWFAHRH